MNPVTREQRLAELTRLIASRRPALKAAAKAHDGETYGRLWREIDAACERLLPDDLPYRSVLEALSPSTLEAEP